MQVTYYKRFLMEFDLRHAPERPRLPAGYRYVAWRDDRLADHAEAKHHSFRHEIDAGVFAALACPEGCQRLMEGITRKPGFLPEATWLVECTLGQGPPEPVGTIQGLRLSPSLGGVQNVGVTPWHRGRGVGRALVQAALFGFRAVGLQTASLEVTAHNVGAVRLYEALGWRKVRTSFRAVETPAPSHALPV